MAEELKSCPFCGSGAHSEHGDGRWYIACDSVGCYCAVGEAYDRDAMPNHIFESEDDAIKVWNTRVSQPRAEVGEVRRIVEGWRENDWPEGFDRRTAQIMADRIVEQLASPTTPAQGVSGTNLEILAATYLKFFPGTEGQIISKAILEGAVVSITPEVAVAALEAALAQKEGK